MGVKSNAEKFMDHWNKALENNPKAQPFMDEAKDKATEAAAAAALNTLSKVTGITQDDADARIKQLEESRMARLLSGFKDDHGIEGFNAVPNISLDPSVDFAQTLPFLGGDVTGRVRADMGGFTNPTLNYERQVGNGMLGFGAGFGQQGLENLEATYGVPVGDNLTFEAKASTPDRTGSIWNIGARLSGKF
tara:strand:- start:2086 stop:2658 length:573 start_codon:yes stop_codon:yes gene_type:complete